MAEVAPVLRNALQTAIRVVNELVNQRTEGEASAEEHTAPVVWPRRSDMQEPKYTWLNYQAELVYALGRLGAFGALTGLVELEGAHLQMAEWRIHLLMGHFHNRYPLAKVWSFTQVPTLRQEMIRLLREIFGINETQSIADLEAYELDAFVASLSTRFERMSRSGS